MYLKSNVLVPGLIYTFTLLVSSNVVSDISGSNSISIIVTTNALPSPGAFIINPSLGVEFETNFTLHANNWNDDDLPLGYEFGQIEVSRSKFFADVSRRIRR